MSVSLREGGAASSLLLQVLHRYNGGSGHLATPCRIRHQHQCWVNPELARNCFRDPDATRDRRRDMSGYYPVTAQDQALARRRRLAKLARHAELLAHVLRPT